MDKALQTLEVEDLDHTITNAQQARFFELVQRTVGILPRQSAEAADLLLRDDQLAFRGRVQLRIEELGHGEMLIRGNIVVMGYLKNPEATAKAFAGGWFRTGDVAVVHPDGYLQITDRSKDVIISGGENISSVEVEDVLHRHPGVLHAAVVAQPDEKWGEVPCAFVERKADAESLIEAELVAFCRDRLAHFKCPRRVIFTELPKTATGKIQKFRLRELAGSREAIMRLAEPAFFLWEIVLRQSRRRTAWLSLIAAYAVIFSRRSTPCR